ncbi:MAG: RES family NAD+ phosphorylase [Actinobacteria bacterium]|nr:RES family NAD+ phosphorylase [Actinomycetota bacterium]
MSGADTPAPDDWPVIGPVAYDNTCRLIPGQYALDAEHALTDLADSDDDLNSLIRLAAATNSRLQAQEEQHPAGLGRTDAVFGVPYSKIINGAFSYGGQGARFHAPGPRGAWYCALDVETCLAEVAFHRIVHLFETGVSDEANIPYRLFRADVHAQEFALLDDGSAASELCLDPLLYEAGQALGTRLRGEHRGGVRYPSVRHDGGVCLAVLQAPVVANVRRDEVYRLSIADYRYAGAVVASA